MSDFPFQIGPSHHICISSMSVESIGMDAATVGGTLSGAAAWPSANLALYIPFTVYTPFTALQMAILNGSTVSGNFDVGIYDREGNQLVHKGSTAQASITNIQIADITDTTLLPGVYYFGLAFDNTTATLNAYSVTNAGQVGGCGILSQATAFTLPATATFATASGTVIPNVAVLGRAGSTI